MHLGVVKVGLLRLAKPEVISLCLLLAKNLCYKKFHPTLTTPIDFIFYHTTVGVKF